MLTLTGGLTLAPICPVFWHYLANNTWLPLGPSLVSQPIKLARATSGLVLAAVRYQSLAPVGIAGRTVALYAILSGAADYRAGLALWLARGADCDVDERHRADRQSNLARSSGGFIALAAGAKSDRVVAWRGIQRLRELNQSLQKELARNQHLAERLLETEESVRRDVARELHDDIGQTITAIRTQAGIVQRLAADNASVKQSGQLIEQLSLGVYDAVRRLLGRLRRRQLDDLTLEQAIRSLMREMELEGRGIVSHLEWRIDESALSENQRVTLFRVCQEGLNNIVKHADASAVTLQGWQQDERLMLVIEDDGSGLPPGSGQQGFGLTGMRERVTALGGTLHISCLHGTRVSVSLPQRYAQGLMMLPFLKAPADAPLMTDKYEIDARYRYWRWHILLTIWLGYALFYFTRKSFNAAVPEILANGALSRSDIGLLATLFYITYGVSKFVSGIVSDCSNARYFMGIGLIATGIMNILFGFSTSLWAFAVLWALNAFFQGWGSPVRARLLTAWYSRTERGGWWALWNTAHNVGGALIPIVMAASALHYGWRAGMMIAGCMAIVVGIFSAGGYAIARRR